MNSLVFNTSKYPLNTQISNLNTNPVVVTSVSEIYETQGKIYFLFTGIQIAAAKGLLDVQVINPLRSGEYIK